MLNDQQKVKVQYFINDPQMSEAVYKVLQNAFLKKHLGPNDVNVLAAERLAVDFLNDAFKELEKFKNLEAKEPTQLKQVGL